MPYDDPFNEYESSLAFETDFYLDDLDDNEGYNITNNDED